MKPVEGKSLSTIKQEWDSIAEWRHDQMTSGKDLSYRFVIVPCVLGLCEGCDFTSVVDIGCASGVLTKELASRCREVIGIDISEKSLELARKLCESLNNVYFVNEMIEDFSARSNSSRFTLAIANMTLMTCIDLKSALQAMRRLLIPGGVFVATITHPCFWPSYWGYSSAAWFDYKREIIIEAAFRISSEASQYLTTHVHRPLETYLLDMIEVGFHIDKIVEPIPDDNIQGRYPSPWRYPRFLGIRCIRK